MQEKVVRVKILHPDAVLPKRMTIGSAGADLTATERIGNGKYITYKTGIAMAIPRGYVGLLFPRSSISKKNLMLTNSVGVIDSDYRGEIEVRFKRAKTRFDKDGKPSMFYPPEDIYEVGERIAQLVIVPHVDAVFKEAGKLKDPQTRSGGFGSTDEEVQDA